MLRRWPAHAVGGQRGASAAPARERVAQARAAACSACAGRPPLLQRPARHEARVRAACVHARTRAVGSWPVGSAARGSGAAHARGARAQVPQHRFRRSHARMPRARAIWCGCSGAPPRAPRARRVTSERGASTCAHQRMRAAARCAPCSSRHSRQLQLCTRAVASARAPRLRWWPLAAARTSTSCVFPAAQRERRPYVLYGVAPSHCVTCSQQRSTCVLRLLLLVLVLALLLLHISRQQ